jgi:hypothetical protein
MHCLSQTWATEIDELGFAVLRGVFSVDTLDNWLRDLTAALSAGQAAGATMYGSSGEVYASRNLLANWPPSGRVWRQDPLPAVLHHILGQNCGLVRALYFDKPPEQTWALPWHKDLTIAVRDNGLRGNLFQRPTTKAGVPHLVAPLEVLRNMLTCRIHLDEVTEENGPLKVIPGSHQSGKVLNLAAEAPTTVLADRGDVLLMRPLLAHCSHRSRPGTRRHRRILHLEFAASPTLPDGYEWYAFIPGRAA